MALFEPAERRFAERFAELLNSNPFLPEWVEKERQLLGEEFEEAPPVYSWRPEWGPEYFHPNLLLLGERIDELTERLRQRLADGVSATVREMGLYEDVVLYYLLRQHAEGLDERIEAAVAGQPGMRFADLWKEFRKSFERCFGFAERRFPSGVGRFEAAHLFACFFQMRRAHYHIFRNIIGTSAAVAHLRGAVWQSIITHDMRRWGRSLYRGMKDFPTLITGPSGTGKELVAQAVGRSLYIPLDPRRGEFVEDFTTVFHPLNLAALAPTLIESELFGHVAGAFTGAVKDRQGWLETCGEGGAVFLDELGELTRDIQVKLLRVLQTRRLQRLGDTNDQAFKGKIIAATNRDLAAEVHAGRFREDLYYRLCADRITTPSLREQLADQPDDLPTMVGFIARRVVGEAEAAGLAAEVVDWIDQHLGRDYAWPGNFRELEQCVRSFTIRKDYQPLHAARPAAEADPRRKLADAVLAGTLTAAELEGRYYTLVFAQAGSYQAAAERLGCDWRTIRGRIDRELLRQLRQA